MFTFQNLVLGLFVASNAVSAAPLSFRSLFGLASRAVINHDAVVGFPQTVPSGLAGTLYLKYKPYLEVHNGCVPFPAVNSAGDTGGGLATSGGQNERCEHNLGQVYARAATYNGYYAIMYSWYMPKDSPSSGLGHRHDWENIVVWVSSFSDTATIRGVAISAHGEYQKTTSPHLTGTRPRIGYISFWPVNHQLIDETKQGGEQPLIAWESLTPEARSAIENTNFGDATPSFRDNNFQNYLADALI